MVSQSLLIQGSNQINLSRFSSAEKVSQSLLIQGSNQIDVKATWDSLHVSIPFNSGFQSDGVDPVTSITTSVSIPFNSGFQSDQ